MQKGMEGQGSVNEKPDMFITTAVKKEPSLSASCSSTVEPLSCREAKDVTSGLQTVADQGVEKELPFGPHEHHELSREQEVVEEELSFSERTDMVVMDIDEEELSSLSASCDFSSAPLSCCADAQDRAAAEPPVETQLPFRPHEHQPQLSTQSFVCSLFTSTCSPQGKVKDQMSGLQTTADETVEKKHRHQHQISRENVTGLDNFRKAKDMIVTDIDEEDIKILSRNVGFSGEKRSFEEGQDKVPGLEIAEDLVLEQDLPSGPQEHEESEDQQGGAKKMQHMVVMDVDKEDLTNLSASCSHSVQPVSFFSEVKERVSELQTTADEIPEKALPLDPHEHPQQVSTAGHVFFTKEEDLDSLSGLVDMFITAIVNEELNSLSVNYVSSAEPVSFCSEDLAQNQEAGDMFEEMWEKKGDEPDIFFTEILDQVMCRSVPCSSAERFYLSGEVNDELIDMQSTKDQVPLELQCQPSREMRLASFPFTFPEMVPKLSESGVIYHEGVRAEDEKEAAEEIEEHIASVLDMKLAQVEVSDVKVQAVQSSVLDQSETTGTSVVAESLENQFLRFENFSSLLFVTNEMLSPGVPSSSYDATTPAAEDVRCHPQLQGKLWLRKFHSVPKFRIKSKHFKRRTEAQELQIQSAENFVVSHIPSEVQEKTLPPAAPSTSSEETTPVTEADHSLPHPQGWSKFRIRRFHLVPKFRTRMKYLRNRVKSQELQSAEISEVLDIPSEVQEKTLPPAVSSASSEETTPVTEADHSPPQPQGWSKFRIRKFYLVPKFRTRMKDRVESPIQPAEGSEVLNISSEVQEKTLPPAAPSTSSEETTPVTEADHSLPHPQGWSKFRIRRFHLVPKFRTRMKHLRNRVKSQELQSAEISEVLDIPSEVQEKTLPPAVSSASSEETTPVTEADHSLPQPQGWSKFRIRKFYLVPKFRTRMKDRVESPIQPAEGSEVLNISSEVQEKTLPPAAPSTSSEETSPVTEADHSLPHPQGWSKFRIRKFHLVPKFRTRMKHLRSRVKLQELHTTEISEVLDIPSEVQEKTLPPAAPSTSSEVMTPVTEADYCLPHPQGWSKFRIRRFYLVPKFRTRMKHFKNKVEPLIESSEGSEASHVPSESTTRSSLARMLSTIFGRFSCFKCHSRH
ncbi:hypothetical protein GN956_G13250 [Arapaima gigas]